MDSSSDDDLDSLTNLEEYAFRLNPEKSEKDPPARLETDTAGALYFIFRHDERNANVRYFVETTEDLRDSESWNAIAQFGPLDAQDILQPEKVAAVEVHWSSPQASVGVLQEVYVQVPPLESSPRFYRVRLEEVE